MERRRVQIILPDELIREVDEVVGRRRRSEFFEEAVRERLRRVKLIAAAERAAGSLANVDISGWETSESTVKWIRACRGADEERLLGN